MTVNMNYSNCMLNYSISAVTEFVFEFMGPRCLDANVRLATIVVYSVIFVFGTVGNLCTCTLIIRDKSMKTATNYYLFSLAISDLVQLIIGLPLELYQTITVQYPYKLPLFVCKGRAYIAEVNSYASIATITAFSIERWLAICYPFKIQLFSKLSRAVTVIGAIWLVGWVCAAPVAYFMTINTATVGLVEAYKNVSFGPVIPKDVSSDGVHIRNTEFCSLDFWNPTAMALLINFAFWCFFVLPILVIIVLYIHIAVRIKTTINGLSQSSDHGRQQRRAISKRKAVLRVLVAVVLAFFVCWLPYHSQRMLILTLDFTNLSYTAQKFYNMIFFLSGYFYYSNSAVNPIIYSVLSQKFRHAFVRAFCPASIARFFPSSSTCPTRSRVIGTRANDDSPSRRVGLSPTNIDVSESYDCLLKVSVRQQGVARKDANVSCFLQLPEPRPRRTMSHNSDLRAAQKKL